MDKTKRGILIAIAVIILVAAILIVGILVLNKERAATETTNTKSPATITGTVSPAPSNQENYDDVVQSTVAKMKSGTATANDLIDLGVAYYNLGNSDQAIAAYEKAIVSDPNSAHAYNNLANILRDQQKYDEAEQDYRKAVALDIHYTAAYLNLAHMLFNFESNSAAAITVLQSGVADNPDDQTLKNLLDEYSQ